MRYINILAGIRLYAEMILAGFCVLLLIFFGGACLYSEIDHKRKVRLLRSYQCERYMSGVPSVADGEFYSWKTQDYAINIDERDVKRMPYKKLKSYLDSKVSG